MRKLILLLGAIGSFVLGFGQTEANPVKWNFGSKALGENQYELTFTASILKHWHIYDLNPTEDADKFLPIATAIEFTPSSTYQLLGKLSSNKPIAHREPSLDVTLYYHENQMILKQKIKLKEEKSTKIKVVISYQACIEENGSERRNMPQDEIFEIRSEEHTSELQSQR